MSKPRKTAKRRPALVQLPGPRNMKTLLLAVSNESHFKQHLYPRWLNQARRKLTPEGVAMMIAEGIHHYLRLFEGDAKKRMAGWLDEMVVELVGVFIDDLANGIKAYKFYDAARQKALAAAEATA